MSEMLFSSRAAHIRGAIHGFVRERLDAKLEELSSDDPKHTELVAKHQPAAWLKDAAKRVSHIQAATHSLKPIHPHARGSNLYVALAQLPRHSNLGSHVLESDFAADVVGDAAALGIYKFLKLEIDGRSLLDLLLAEDSDALNALDDDPTKASQLRNAFVSLVQPNGERPSSHTFAKQMYWYVDRDADPSDDTAYHLLAPLYPTSLVHEIYSRIQEDRFGEVGKAARQARREGKYHEGVTHDYPALAVQKLGGSNKQNISQLNNERGGQNYLLSCAPPTWKPVKQRGLFKTSSIFDHIYGELPIVRGTIYKLRKFLEEDPRPVMETRNKRDEYIATLIDELVQLAAGYQKGFSPGWSLNSETKLNEDECLWLDPYRATFEAEYDFREKWLWMDWPEKIGERFARWLKGKLEGKLPIGDVEFHHWKKELLLDESESGWAKELHKMCHEIRKKCKGFPSTKKEDETAEIVKETEAGV